MAATTLNCPTCGASISSDQTRCRYCGTRLATISCPNCFGMMFLGSKFCPHCGAKAEAPVDEGPALSCPNCDVIMKRIMLKQTPLQECQKCLGLWVDATSFDRVCADRERQADVLALSPDEQRAALEPHLAPGPVKYRPCPRCGQLMNRFNFAHTSGVIVDKCAAHGVWFDRDELRRIIDFLRAGGMDLSRQKEWDEKTRRARELDAQSRVDAVSESFTMQDPDTVGRVLHVLGRIIGAGL
jgi:Zn-finger nucleic acid-binding protein